MLSKQAVEAEVERLGPFHHNVELPHGVRTVPRGGRKVSRKRLSRFLKRAWPPLLEACGGSLEGKRVLDVACNCGGFSVEAAKAGASYVLGIDIVNQYLAQANFIKDCLSLENVEFRKLALEDLTKTVVGEFDVTFCFGILYHLDAPVPAMQTMASVTREVMLLDTRVIRRPLEDDAIWLMKILSKPEENDETATTSMWRDEDKCQFMPNERAVEDLLRFVGFSQVEIVKNAKLSKRDKLQGSRSKGGDSKGRVTFLARK